MKTFLLLISLTAPLLADAPKKPLPSRYLTLHTSSPFTTPAPPVSQNTGPEINPMDEWALGGVTKFPDGYFVILLNKKKPDEKKIIQPGVHSEFKVVSVKDGGMDYTATTVTLQNGGKQGIVEFDSKMLTINNPAPAAGGQPGVQPAAPGQPVSNNRGIGNDRQPRLRTLVPTPAPPQAPAQPQVQQQAMEQQLQQQQIQLQMQQQQLLQQQQLQQLQQQQQQNLPPQ
jgi:hypothetical protein